MILDLTACRDEGRFTGLAERAAACCAAPMLNDLMALGPRGAHRAAPPGERTPRGELRGLPRQSSSGRPAPGAAGRCRDAAPRRDRGLHRFLRVRAPRDQRRQHVPARQPAAAELQVGAHRLPRTRLVHRAERHADRPAGRTEQGPGHRRSELRTEPVARLRDGAGAAGRRGQPDGTAGSARTGGGADVRLLPGQRLVGAGSPVLGVPAARARSWPRTSPPRSRPGSSRRRRWRRSGRRPSRGRPAIRRRYPISTRGATRSRARSR